MFNEYWRGIWCSVWKTTASAGFYIPDPVPVGSNSCLVVCLLMCQRVCEVWALPTDTQQYQLPHGSWDQRSFSSDHQHDSPSFQARWLWGPGMNHDRRRGSTQLTWEWMFVQVLFDSVKPDLDKFRPLRLNKHQLVRTRCLDFFVCLSKHFQGCGIMVIMLIIMFVRRHA